MQTSGGDLFRSPTCLIQTNRWSPKTRTSSARTQTQSPTAAHSVSRPSTVRSISSSASSISTTRSTVVMICSTTQTIKATMISTRQNRGSPFDGSNLSVLMASAARRPCRWSLKRQSHAPSCASLQNLTEELFGSFGLRLCEERLWVGHLDDAAVLHESHPVADLAGESHLVGDHDHRHAVVR